MVSDRSKFILKPSAPQLGPLIIDYDTDMPQFPSSPSRPSFMISKLFWIINDPIYRASNTGKPFTKKPGGTKGALIDTACPVSRGE